MGKTITAEKVTVEKKKVSKAAAKSTEAKKLDLSYLHFGIILLFMFGFGYLPPVGEITPVGMKMVGVFIGLLYGWSFCGMFWPSLLGWLAIGFCGLGTVPEILCKGFGNEIIVFLVFILVLVQMLIDSGAVNNVATWVMSRKFLQGKPWMFSFVFLCACGLLSTFGQAYAAFFLCWGILFSIFDKVGYKPYQAYPAIMICGVVISASAFGIMLPFKSMPLVILSTFQSITGITVNYLQYMAVMVPLGLCMMGSYLLICKLFLRPDVSLVKEFDVEKLSEEGSEMTKRQKATLIAFGFALLVLLLPGSLPATWPIIGTLKSIGTAGLMLICTVLFTLIKVEGEPILDFSKSARMGISWPIMFMVTVVMLMSSLLMSDATGLKPFFVTLLSPVLSGFSGMMFIVVLFLMTLLLTNFMNNIVVGIMFIPVLGVFYESVGVNPIVGVIMILIAINTAFLTPAASPATALCYAKSDWIEFSMVFKIMVCTIIAFMICGLTVGLGLASLVF